MRKFLKYLFLLPLAIVLILLSVANRQAVIFSMDPLNTETPALSLELPLFVFLFVTFVVGMLVGGLMVWLSQGKYRKALREKSHEAEQLQRARAAEEKQNSKPVEEIAPGLPLVSSVS